MAFINKTELSNGLVCDKAYIKIQSISGGKEMISIQIQGWISQDAYIANKDGLFSNYYSFKPSVEDGSENFIKQAYTYLKSLDEYAEAIDI